MAKSDQFIRMWMEGASPADIGAVIGISARSVPIYANRLRKSGVDLPCRRPGRPRRDATTTKE